jgi:hypothetical protein
MWAARHALVLAAVFVAKAGSAGEIAGLLPPLPPFHQQDFALVFSNDFLGRGGSVDDYRTQQVVVSTRLADRWSVLLDHSILTLNDGVDAGRIDQLAVSFGYDWVRRDRDGRTDTVAVGFGARGEGSFGGERIQNGFHRLIGSKTEDLPYVAGDSYDATLWLDASHYRLLRDAGHGGLLPGWRKGAWVRVGSLLTTGGQWDGTVSALAVAGRESVDIWFGARADWREGYEKDVLRETARAEADVAVVLGARFGALVIETVQQLNNEASYGQLRLVSTGRRNRPAEDFRPRIAVDFGVSMPDVTVRIAGKYAIPGLWGPEWQESIVLAGVYGEPQYKSNNRLYVRNRQIEAGLEFERPWVADSDWLDVFAVASAGWREQALILENEAGDQRTDDVGRAVITVGGGVRVNAAGSAHGWQLRIQAGLFATLPFASADLDVNGDTYQVQEATLDALLGFTADFE